MCPSTRSANKTAHKEQRAENFPQFPQKKDGQEGLWSKELPFLSQRQNKEQSAGMSRKQCTSNQNPPGKRYTWPPF